MSARHWCATALIVTALVVLMPPMMGCEPQHTRMELTRYSYDGSNEELFQDFADSFYKVDPGGNIDLVARQRTMGDDGAELTQVVHVRTFFRAVPGETAVDSTMINAIVRYAVIRDDGGVMYEGGGFVTCKQIDKETVLVGELEQSKLRPNRQVGAPLDFLDLAVLKGEFRARRDRRELMRVTNELQRLFGKQPDYRPQPTTPNLL